jgi:hypothetical protein
MLNHKHSTGIHKLLCGASQEAAQAPCLTFYKKISVFVVHHYYYSYDITVRSVNGLKTEYEFGG